MSIFEKKQEHPSYGMLGFSRVTCGGKTTLFGSSIQHSNTIRLTLKSGAVERGLNSDWYHADRPLFEVEMSQTQFAELITSLNMGDGVPVTIRYINGEEMPPIPFESKADMHREEFRESLNKTYSNAQSLISKVSGIFTTKKTLTKKDREEILSSLRGISADLKQKQDYQVAQFQKQMEKTVSEAKGEVEAFVSGKLLQLGQQKLVEEYPDGTAATVSMPEISGE